MDRERLTLAQVEWARDRLAGQLHVTPLIRSRTLSELTGGDVALKAELFQKTGSFKSRGMLYRLLQTSEAERARGFVTISAGNAAAALAWAASTLGSHAVVVMPSSAVRSKIEATRAYGGDVRLTDGDLMAACDALRDAHGLTFVHPFDDLEVMTGHAVIGLEIAEQFPQVEAVVVPIGGGGLIGGIAPIVKARFPAAEVIGVEPLGADVMSRSLARGEVATLDRADTVADGLAAPFAGQHTLRQVQRHVDRVVLVSDAAILAAAKLLWTRCKLAAEASGAAALAALLDPAGELRNRAVCCVVSGGNVDPRFPRRLFEA